MLKKLYAKKASMLIPATLVTIVMLFGTSAYAAGAIEIDGTFQVIPGPDTIRTTGFIPYGEGNSYSDNPDLNFSSSAHNSNWYNFENRNTSKTTLIQVFGDRMAPGISVWASGNTPFDGGTTGFGDEVSTAGRGTPHVFNSHGAIGDPGTLWMADGQGGNIKETLAYAMTGPTHLNSASPTGWGEDMVTGAHDVSLTNTFENGITGSVSRNYAVLEFKDLAVGWYTVYVAGSDTSRGGGEYNLVVSALPETKTWAMLLAGLGLIGWRLRKQESEPNMLPA